MRREGALTAAAAVLALAALAWGWLWLSSRLRGPEIVRCRRETIEETVTLAGTVERDELLLRSEAAVILPLADAGERVAAGAPLALAGEDARAIFPAALLLRLRREQAAEAPSVSEAVRGLRRAAARGEFSPVLTDAAGRALGLAGFEPERLAPEILALERAGAEAAVVAAPAAGLRAPGGWGRLVVGREWIFSSPQTDERLAPGSAVTVRLPDGTEVRADVLGGDGTVLRGDRGLAALLDDGEITLTAVLERREGYLLPAAALREEDGSAWVLRWAGGAGARADVAVLWRRGEDVLVASDSLRDGTAVLLKER